MATSTRCLQSARWSTASRSPRSASPGCWNGCRHSAARTAKRRVSPNAIWHTFGTSLFVRLYPIQSFFLLVEGELINTGFTQGDFTSGRTNFGNLFLGGGYVQGVGRGAFVAVSLKVNVFRNAFYPSNIPIFGVGAGFGF